MKDIKTLYFEDVECFVSYVMCKLDELDLINYEDISIIASASEVANFVTEFIRYGMDIDELYVSSPDYDLYDGEYVITLSNLGISCEKLKRNGEYFNVDGTIVYVSGDANSKCLSYIKSDNIYSFDIEEDNEFFESDGNYTVTIKTNINDNEIMNVIDETEECINKIKMRNFLYGMFMFEHLFS